MVKRCDVAINSCFICGHRQVVCLGVVLPGLVVVAIAARYKGYRYPIEVIGHAVWLYHRFALSLRCQRHVKTDPLAASEN